MRRIFNREIIERKCESALKMNFVRDIPVSTCKSATSTRQPSCSSSSVRASLSANSCDHVTSSCCATISKMSDCYKRNVRFSRMSHAVLLASATCIQKNRLRDRFSGSKSRQVTGQRFIRPNFRQESRTGFKAETGF